MRGRLARTAFVCLLLSPLLSACFGDGGPAALPATGAVVCDKLKESERFRYTQNYILESKQQENPPDDATDSEGYFLKPSRPDLRLNIKHSGAAQRPDRLDYEISLPDQPDQAPAREIRIGENRFVLVGDAWQAGGGANQEPFNPLNICERIVSPLDLAGKVVNQENLGDTKTRHVRIDGASLTAAAQLFGPASDMGRLLTSFDVDLWLRHKDHRPVKIEAVSKASFPYGRELSIRFVLEIGSYNDDEIDIQPPPI